jgi:cell shape-determining protein MreC
MFLFLIYFFKKSFLIFLSQTMFLPVIQVVFDPTKSTESRQNNPYII